MGVTPFPNGISSFGVPQLGGVSIPSTTGKYWFVDSVTGSNGNSGKDSVHPVATIDYAVGLCTANKGDIIIVMPGHNESITAATSLVVDVEGVSIIGLGVNQSRPMLDFDNTAGSIEMDAANCRLSNVVLRASVTAVVVAINVDANDITLDNIETTWEATGDDFLMVVDMTAVDRCTIVDCKFFGELAVAGGDTIILADDSHNLVFQRNMLVGNANVMFSNAATLSQCCVVTDNIIYNADTTDNSCMEVSVASTGIMARNIIGSLGGAQAWSANLDPGSYLCAENYLMNAVDESGIIFPSTTPS
jgi:hypothetical protein